ncbi:vancomycin resistance protein [Lactococcus raffinolactis]|uniref:VanW family protein n=1 Tax=Pseudolactococcus raffinolactis TaxID=1366 RepID=UPI000BB4A243|nr:VanW family protein [Lactococcus raffinolactis]ATC61274.1 vancomycin resistance protein [Lactococcus raffinolactis]MBW9331547.1 vancomycin resistance protein [Lactococcus raffinolactis]QIW56895.1 VanW family protein [Lactococcus raffinolactis]
MVFWNKELLFCDINPTCYAISVKKENLKRHLQDLKRKENFATDFQKEKLTYVVSERSSNMIKRAEGVDLASQFNKAKNIELACQKLNGLVIKPGEVFSFWKLVGKISEKKGYKAGRVIERNKLILGIGGGICNLANTINLLVIHSPLLITEFHTHSDALAPDETGRIPLNAGTSVSYNHIDYRFKNTTNQSFQLMLWCEGEVLHAALRSERELPYTYDILEENHHFTKEKEKFYRISKIYKATLSKTSGDMVEKTLIWDNHSEVMFDYGLIPKDQIRFS